MMPLTAQYLARQRAYAERELVERAEIHRNTETQNDMGETIKAWAPVASDVPCKVVAVNSMAMGPRQLLDAVAITSRWQLVFVHDIDVQPEDKIFVITQSPIGVYRVRQQLGPHTDEVRRLVDVEQTGLLA